MFRRGEWPSTSHLQDAAGLFERQRTDRRAADEEFSDHQRSGDGCFVELQSQQEDSAFHTARECHLEDGPARRRSRAGVSQVY